MDRGWNGYTRKANDIRLYKFAKELGKERFGVAYYINELYAKWCPYDNLDWILNTNQEHGTQCSTTLLYAKPRLSFSKSPRKE